MKTVFRTRITMIGMAFALLCSAACIPAAGKASAAQATFYVDAAHGSDVSGDGSSGSPWASIGHAAALAQAGDTVKIRSGTYRETVTPANSGMPGAPISYEADTGADVTISGADLITGAWSVHSGAIYATTATLGMGQFRDQVFVDGEAVNLARTPNAGTDPMKPVYLQTDAGTDNAKIIDGELTQPAGYWNGAAVIVADQYRWTIAGTTVASYTPGRLNLDSIATFGLSANSPYYLVGKLAALDSADEWFYDDASHALYLETPAGDNPANHVVEAKARTLAFDLHGKTGIRVKGVKLFASTIDASASSYIDIDGIDAKYLSHYELDTAGGIDNFGTSGIRIGGSHNILHNSKLAYSPGNLVTLDGDSNQIVNNTMHDAAYGPVYTTNQANIYVNGTNMLISNNTLYNSGRSVISGRPNNGRIQYNLAYNAQTLTDDGGFMYFSNVDGNGTEIHHNVLRGADTSPLDGGIYLDFACFDFNVFDNVVSDTNLFGVFFHSYTLFTQAYNNTFYDTSTFKMKDDGGATDAYGTRVVNNIATDKVAIAPAFGVVERHNLKSGDPLFADPANGDFRLRPSSPAIDAGEAIPGVTDGFAGSAPDIGAYENGAADWQAGADYDTPPNPAFTTTPLPYQQLVKNGFFEYPLQASADWTKTGGQTASIAESGNTATASRYTFTRGLKLGSGIDGVEQTVTGLKPNTEYELRGFGKAATSGQAIRLGVKGFGGDEQFKEVTATAWTKQKMRFTTGPSDTGATIYVTKTTTGGFAYADDVTLVEFDPAAPAEAEPGDDGGTTTPGVTTVNDRDIGTGLDQFEYGGTAGQGAGSWLQGPNINAYKGDASFSQTAGDYYNVRFQGTQVKLYSEQGPVMGIVAVSVDGGPETLIDLYSADDVSQILAYTSPELSEGPHLLKVRVTGDSNPAGGGTWHVADKVEVPAPPSKLANDRDIGTGLNEFEYGGIANQGAGSWLQGPNINAYKGDASFSQAANDYYQIRFAGKQIKLYSEQGPVMGIVAVSIDGGAETMIDLYSADDVSQVLVYTSPALGAGQHILKVRVTGNANPAGSGTWTVADKAEIVDGAGTADPDPTPDPVLVDRFAQDFESSPVGAVPDGWTSGADNQAGVTADGDGNHVLTIAESGTDGVDSSASVSFDPIRTKADAKLRVKADQVGGTGSFLTLTDGGGVKLLELMTDYDYAHTGMHSFARRTPDGNWSNLLEYNVGEWYDFEVVLDFANQTYGIKIDGADVEAGIPFLHAASNVAGYSFSAWGYSPGTYHVDNLVIAGPEQEQTVPVTAVAVAGEHGASTIDTLGGTLQMLATVTPDNATDKSVAWSVVAEDGSAANAASIDANGLLTATADGVVKVVAAAKDGSGVRGSTLVTIDSAAHNPDPQLAERFAEDFEGTAAGAVPLGWTTGADDQAGVTVDGEGNHRLTIAESGADGVTSLAGIAFDPIRTKAVVKLRVMAEQTGATSSFLALTDSTGANVLELLTDLDYGQSGAHNFAYRTPDGNWSNLQPYAINQWYAIEVDLDFVHGMYAVKIDGATVGADIPFLHAAGDIAGYSFSAWGWSAGTYHVDDVRISGPSLDPGNPPVNVANIAVAGEDGAARLDAIGGTLQMHAVVTPDNATDQAVDWTVTAADGTATSAAAINANGLLTAAADGVVKVVASAKDGSGVHGERLVTIDSAPPAIATPGKLTFFQSEAVAVSFAATDAVSGLQSIALTFNGSTVNGSASAGPIALPPLALAVGTYPIVVTATDNFGHAATKTYSLVIAMDIDHLDELIAAGLGQGLLDNAGTANSLLSHVDQVQRDQGDKKKLQNSIKAFENKLKAQRGKHIDAGFADLMLDDLARLKLSLGI